MVYLRSIRHPLLAIKKYLASDLDVNNLLDAESVPSLSSLSMMLLSWKGAARFSSCVFLAI